MNKFDIMAVIIGVLGAIIGLIAWDHAANDPHNAPHTVLVGFGCESPSSVAVATEEDLLPRCAEIERHEVARR